MAEYTVEDVEKAVKRKYKKKSRRAAKTWSPASIATSLVYSALIVGTAYLGWLFLKEREKLFDAHQALLQRLSPRQAQGSAATSQPTARTPQTTPTGPPPSSLKASQ